MGKVENSFWAPSGVYLVHWLIQTMAISVSLMGLAGQALFSFRYPGSLETIAGFEESPDGKLGLRRGCVSSSLGRKIWSWKKVGRATCLYTGYLMGHLYFFLYSKSSLRDIYQGNVTLCPLNRI